MSCNYIQQANSGIQDLAPYQPGKPISELQRELGLTHIVKMASNENPLGCSAQVQEACKEQLNAMAYYPDSTGHDLKQLLSARLDVAPKCIVLGNGSNDILDLLAQVFLNADSSALFSQYGFIVYPIATQVASARAIVVPANDWGHDTTAMSKALAEDTRLIFLANPNNPTGTYFSHAQLAQFLAAVPAHVIVVLDEAYYEYCAHLTDYPRAFELQQQYPNLVISRTFSKAYGLAGFRVGYAVASEQIADLLNRARAPFNVNSLALCAARAALADDAFVARSVDLNQVGLEQVKTGLQKLQLETIDSVANFITFAVDDALQTYQKLLAKGIIVRPLGVYAMPHHLRVSIGTQEQNQLFLQALERVI